jgi:Alr-MurF fusion protein
LVRAGRQGTWLQVTRLLGSAVGGSSLHALSVFRKATTYRHRKVRPMDPISLVKLAEVLGGRLWRTVSVDQQVRHASIHSDHIRSGTAFFALRGRQTDGHRFVDRAFSNGAVVAVVSGFEVQKLPADAGPLILVDDPLRSLRILARWWRAQLSAEFVAVVGNVGKTVTKDALVSFLGHHGQAYGSPGSYNSQVGVPLSILECPRASTLAVIEAAATEPGEMLRLTDLIMPKYVLLTNIGSRWESNFDGAIDQAREMVRIADRLPSAGWLIVGELDPVLRQVAATLRVKTYVLDESAGLPVFSAPDYGPDGIATLVTFPDAPNGTVSVRTPSESIARDVKLAIAAAWLLGVPSSSLLEAARDYTPTSARMEVWRSPTGITVIRDIATADGAIFAGAARVAKPLTKQEGRTVVVLIDRYEQCTRDAATALGQTIGRAQIDELCTLALPVHGVITSSAIATKFDLKTISFTSPSEMQQHLSLTLRAGDVVLIQSPRDRSISELSVSLVEPIASTRLFIDQSAIESNVTSIRRLVGTQVQLMGMVKALAYGTNPVQISVCLESAGVDALAVATVDEGVALRMAGVSLETILVMLASEDEIERMVHHRLTPLIYSPGMFEAVARYAASEAPPFKVHVEVDSGMHRTGLDPDDALKALQRMRGLPSVVLGGLMTHFACADMPSQDEFTHKQLAIFEGVTNAAYDLGFTDFVRHAANTAATMRLPATRLDMVRVGIGLFGVYPFAETAAYAKLTPAVSLVSKIVEIHDLAAGEPVGYGSTFRTPSRGSRIGVVAAGYHDCVPRAFSNFGSVMVNGQKCPIVGTVSMDSMTVDLSGCPEAVVGTDVTIYGGQGESFVSIEEVARKIDTIPYELLVRIGPRVQRVFTRH